MHLHVYVPPYSYIHSMSGCVHLQMEQDRRAPWRHTLMGGGRARLPGGRPMSRRGWRGEGQNRLEAKHATGTRCEWGLFGSFQDLGSFSWGFIMRALLLGVYMRSPEYSEIPT